MITQYKYKVLTPFCTHRERVLKITQWTSTKSGKKPFGLNCYKPSNRKFDYVDYEGDDIEQCISTKILVDRGVIEYIGKREL